MSKKKFTRAKLEELKRSGKIRGFSEIKSTKAELKTGIPELNGRKVIKHWPKKSKEKDWIASNLLEWCTKNGYELQEEFRFHETRRWRFDWCIPKLMLAIEYEGGILNPNGDHRSVKGISRDIEKYNCATGLGWRVIRFTAKNYSTLLIELNKYLK